MTFLVGCLALLALAGGDVAVGFVVPSLPPAPGRGAMHIGRNAVFQARGGAKGCKLRWALRDPRCFSARGAAGPSGAAGCWMTATDLGDSSTKDAGERFEVRRATMEDLEGACDLSMEAFYGQSKVELNPLNALSLFETPRGGKYRSYEHVLTRWEVQRRITRVLSAPLRPEGEDGPLRPPTSAVFVAVDTGSGELVGLVELIKLSYPCAPGPRRPYLFNLCVRQQNRKMGIGGKLVSRCEEEAVRWGYSEQFLHVEHEDILAMYEGLGYVSTHMEPSFFELHFKGLAVADYNRAALRPGGWVMMHKKLADPALDASG